MIISSKLMLAGCVRYLEGVELAQGMRSFFRRSNFPITGKVSSTDQKRRRFSEISRMVEREPSEDVTLDFSYYGGP